MIRTHPIGSQTILKISFQFSIRMGVGRITAEHTQRPRHPDTAELAQRDSTYTQGFWSIQFSPWRGLCSGDDPRQPADYFERRYGPSNRSDRFRPDSKSSDAPSRLRGKPDDMAHTAALRRGAHGNLVDIEAGVTKSFGKQGIRPGRPDRDDAAWPQRLVDRL